MVITKDTYLPSYEDLEVEEIKLSSPALKAGATHFGLYCDDVSKVRYSHDSSPLSWTFSVLGTQ